MYYIQKIVSNSERAVSDVSGDDIYALIQTTQCIYIYVWKE